MLKYKSYFTILGAILIITRLLGYEYRRLGEVQYIVGGCFLILGVILYAISKIKEKPNQDS